MAAFATEIAAGVGLEGIAIDDDWLGCLGRGALGGAVGFVVLGRHRRVGVGDDERQAPAVGRPGVVGDAALDVGQPDRFAARPS